MLQVTCGRAAPPATLTAVPSRSYPHHMTTAATIDDVIARMREIDASLPASDGVACFNRMYLDVTLAVNQKLHEGTFADAAFMTQLDVVFANLYFAAVDAAPSSAPAAWAPLLAGRDAADIEPIQFALAGMNVHINHDLPLAVVRTCLDLHTSPPPHHDDYRKIDELLDAAEQSVRESFEPPDVQVADRHVAAVLNLVDNWSINTARDVAWDTALALWTVRGQAFATELMTDALARLVAMASRALLVAV